MLQAKKKKKWQNGKSEREKAHINMSFTCAWFSWKRNFKYLFFIHLKAWCLIRFLIITWYLKISLFWLISNMKFNSHIVNLGGYTQLEHRSETRPWVSLISLVTYNHLKKLSQRTKFNPGKNRTCNVPLNICK